MSALLEQAAQRLRQEGLPFALIGAAAMAVHGVSRSTYDTDLLVAGPRGLASELWAPLAAAGAKVDLRRGDADDPLLGVVRLAREGEAVDVVVGRPAWQAAVLQRATVSRALGFELPVATAADLVLLKLYAGGPQDRWDIEQLLAGSNGADIVRDVEAMLGELPEHSRELWRALCASRSEH